MIYKIAMFLAGFAFGIFLAGLLASAKINSLTDDYEERLRLLYRAWRDKP